MNRSRSPASDTSRMPKRCSRPAASRRSRRGLTLLVVILLISMTLGLSYAAMRSQSTSQRIHRNCGRRRAARAIALTGLIMAIKKMHQSDWNGVGTDLTGSLGGDENYRVTYTTGDPSLTPGHPDYEDLPYRVTLLSTGFAADPDHPTSIATHQVRAVLRLIPRALAEEPADWDEMMQYTLGQWRDGFFGINVPFRVEGRVRMQQGIDLSAYYPWLTTPRRNYHLHLEQMRQNGYPDWRPFDGPVDLPISEQDGVVVSLFNAMNVTTNNVQGHTATGFGYPGEILTYQIYRGGEVYSVEVLGQDHRNVTRIPDPETNPLGIFFRREKVRVYENVTFQGTLITKGGGGADVEIYGDNVRFLPHDLPLFTE